MDIVCLKAEWPTRMLREMLEQAGACVVFDEHVVFTCDNFVCFVRHFYHVLCALSRYDNGVLMRIRYKVRVADDEYFLKFNEENRGVNYGHIRSLKGGADGVR